MKNLGFAIAMATASIGASMAVAAPAYAARQNLGFIAPGTASTAQFIHTGKNTKFTDDVRFSFADSTKTGVGVYTLQFLPGLKNITNATLSLTNLTTGVNYLSNAALTSGSVFAQALTGGLYQATIMGRTTGASGGDYQISFAAPVPEPAVVGSMGLGLGLAALAASRRRRRKVVAA